jgi:4-nitrophenyl phosphatase
VSDYPQLDPAIELTEAAWLLDLDGVVWRGKTAIPGSVEAVDRLREGGNRVVFVSNNSSLTSVEYVAKLASVGIVCPPEDIVTSAMAAASLVPAGATVMVLGGAGINEAVERRGATALAPTNDAIGADLVLVGLDRQLSYDRLTAAVRAVRNGAVLLITNEDPTFPAEGGLNAGGGSIGMAVAYGGGVPPVFAGKPHQLMADTVRAQLGSQAVAIMVGDQPLTDGRFAITMGIPFGLVLSGVTGTAADCIPTPVSAAADLATLITQLGVPVAATTAVS